MEWKLVARKMVYHNSGRVDIEEWHSTSPTVITVSHLIMRMWLMWMMREILRILSDHFRREATNHIEN